MQNTLYSKLFFTILSVILITLPSFAETWEDATIRNKEIYIDTDSVNSHNDSTYYNVKYYDKNSKVYVVATIQNRGNYAGVVSTCKFTDYLKNKNLANPLTNKGVLSIYMHDIQISSLLYNANEMAKRALYIKENPTPESKVSTSNVKFDYYMRNVQKNIKRNWQPPQGTESKRIVVLFTLNKDGHLISSQLSKSSGSDVADMEAINAIKRTYFESLPYGYKGTYVDISFTFDYNVIDKK